MKKAIREFALLVPPLRRLYDFAMFHAEGHASSQKELHALKTVHAELEQRCSQMQAKQEALDLQLYVMRSDQQRTTIRNETLTAALSELESKASRNDESLQHMQQMCASIYERSRSDAEIHYAKLAGRLTMISSEIGRLSRGQVASGGIGTELYLDLLEKSLTGVLFEDAPVSPWSTHFDSDVRAIGRDWPKTAVTMIGSARLRNLRVLADQVLSENVPGDMLEAGVWRGGACILLRGLLAARGVRDRKVWVADSFEGLPPPDPRYPVDEGDTHSTYEALSVSLEQVQENFKRYGLLDEQVRFLKGWFADTLASAPVERLSILRLDGDMYSSTIQTLDALYSKVSPGGFVIVDDYILKGCKAAIHDFREREGVTDEMHDVDGAAVYWRKSK